MFSPAGSRASRRSRRTGCAAGHALAPLRAVQPSTRARQPRPAGGRGSPSSDGCGPRPRPRPAACPRTRTRFAVHPGRNSTPGVPTARSRSSGSSVRRVTPQPSGKSSGRPTHPPYGVQNSTHVRGAPRSTSSGASPSRSIVGVARRQDRVRTHHLVGRRVIAPLDQGDPRTALRKQPRRGAARNARANHGDIELSSRAHHSPQRAPNHASTAVAVSTTGPGWRSRDRGDRV